MNIHSAVGPGVRSHARITPDFRLTPDEVDLQVERGELYRSLLRRYTESMLKDVAEDEVGIALSGGADSVTLLWTLLELGIRPHVLTFDYPTNTGTSADTVRVRRCVEYYRLPYTVAMMTEDPDELARSIAQISDTQLDRLVTRPDFEVAALFETMLQHAASAGITSLFTGMMDGAIHLLGRDYEIRGRGGELGVNECNLRRIQSIPTDQHVALTDMASKRGIELCGPHLPVAALHPYMDVPWHVMNHPRKKAITIEPWSSEEQRIGFKINVASMQTGDSGTREYFDGMLSRSGYAASLVNRRVSSGTVFYNHLKSRWAVPAENKSTPGWFGHVTDGTPLSKKDAVRMSDRVDPETQRAPLPSGFGSPEEESSDDLFGAVQIDTSDTYQLDPQTGLPDVRMDCLGDPFYLGDDLVYTECERARRGLCSSYHPEEPFKFTQCPILATALQLPLRQLEDIAEATGGVAKRTYEQGLEDAEKLIRDILPETA